MAMGYNADTILIIVFLSMAFDVGYGDTGCEGGNFTFHSLFQTGMVLQAKPQTSRIFGFATDYNCLIEVQRTCQHGNGTVKETNSTGMFLVAHKPWRRIWEVELSPESNGVLCNLTARQGQMTKTVSNVRYGDVWVCAGQSNMKVNLWGVLNSTEEREAAKLYTNIRATEITGLLSSIERDDFDQRPRWRSVAELDPSALCYFFLKYLTDFLSDSHVFGMVVTGVGGSTTNAWMSHEALANCPNIKDPSPLIPEKRTDSYIWNARIHPLLRFPIKGALLSMGDDDVDLPATGFACRFRTLISSWRDTWSTLPKTKFPVGFEELRTPPKNDSLNIALFRWHQTQHLGAVPNKQLPQVFSGGSVDIVEPDHITHPRNKQQIARRLSIAAANMAYGLTTFPVHGPFPISRVKSGQTFHVRFAEKIHHNTFDPSTGFYVCCQEQFDQCDSEFDYNWQRVGNNTVTVDHLNAHISVALVDQCFDENGETFRPVGIAYNYASAPVDEDGQGSIYSRDQFHLPAVPWKMKLE